jgi:hypothetical protein
VCILLVWSDLGLDVSALAVVGLEDKDLSLPFNFFEQSILKSMFIARLSRKESAIFFLVLAGSGLRPRTKRVKTYCTLPADYYNIN